MEANDSSMENNEPQELTIRAGNVEPSEMRCNAHTMRMASILHEGIAGATLCSGPVVLSLRRPRWKQNPSLEKQKQLAPRSLMIRIDNFTDHKVEAVLIFTTEPSPNYETQNIMHVSADPRTGTKFRSAWSWLEKIISVDIEFGKPQERKHYYDKYENTQHIIFREYLEVMKQWINDPMVIDYGKLSYQHARGNENWNSDQL